MNHQKIKEILLANGFKEKPQPDGTMDLNPYVYEAVGAVLHEQSKVLTAPGSVPYFFPSVLDVERHNEYQYLNLLADIINNGRTKGDRTGTGTIAVFGRQMRFDLSKGFPLLTTKAVHLKSIIHELLWFIKGDTNIGYLKEHGVKIWDDWAVKPEQIHPVVLSNKQRVKMASIADERTEQSIWDEFTEYAEDEYESDLVAWDDLDDYLHRLGIPTTRPGNAKEGDLGPIYGKQWTAWENKDGTTINQLSQVVEMLKKNPTSRRIIVTGWNPSVLPDESLTPEHNVLLGKQALPPCHTLFQFYAEELSILERRSLLSDARLASHMTTLLVHIDGMDPDVHEAEEHKLFDLINISKYRLSLQLYGRSQDVFLGTPFNVASYSLLLMMVAQVTNMVPGEYIHTSGDTHIYANHMDQVREQLSRYPYSAPTMKLNPNVKKLEDFVFEDFTLENYQSHPAIKAPVAK